MIKLIIMCMALLFLSGCTNGPDMKSVHNEPNFAGAVVEVFDGSMLARVNADDEARIGSDLAFVSLDVYLRGSMTDFMSGDEVVVFFDGMILDSYPVQIANVYAIILTSPCKRSGWTDAERITIMHTLDGHTSGASFAEKERIDVLYDWFVNLLLERSEGPDNFEGIEIYEFTIDHANGDSITFVYGEFGAGEWELLWGEAWYRVNNPSRINFPVRTDKPIIFEPAETGPRNENGTAMADLSTSVPSYEVGKVRLVIGDAEHEPGEHFLHGAMYTDGGLLSASGIPFEFWLDSNIDALPIIQYSPGVQITVGGEYGRIVTFSIESPAYYNEFRQIGILAGNFIDGAADISIPHETGTYLVYVDVHWSGGGNEFTLIRYVFKIAREFTLEDIPAQSPRLDFSLSMEGFPTQHFRAAQGTTNWFPAGGFMDMFQIGDTITGGYEASGSHPLDFWREYWECINFSEFVACFEGTEGKIRLQFSGGLMPDTILVRRWNTGFIGMSSEMWNIYEPVEIVGNVIRISNDGNDYIYEIEARWARGVHPFGRAFYTFRINCSR